MLRVIRTELYFNPLEIKWQVPELIISNPGISAAFFPCSPRGFEFERIISRPVLLGQVGGVLAFLDTALQNAPLRSYGSEYDVLNPGLIRSIYNSEIIIEHSPPEGIQFGKLISGVASLITIGTYVGSGDPLLFLTIPAGIIVVGAAVSIARAFDKGLNHVVERAIGSKDKTPPMGPTTPKTTTPTARRTRKKRT